MRKWLLGGIVLWAVMSCGSPVEATPGIDQFDAQVFPEESGDDGARLQRALDSLRPGQTLRIMPGTYRHGEVLSIRVPHTRIDGHGATLLALHEERSAVRLDASEILLEGLTLGVPTITRRWDAFEQMKLHVTNRSGVTVRNVKVVSSAAAGILVDGAARFRIERSEVSATRADGIQITGGAHGGVISSPKVRGSGDDGVSIVSYSDGREPCRQILVTAPEIAGTSGGRGIGIVGGEDIFVSNVDIRDTNAAALYIAVEAAPYNTLPTRRVSIRGGRLLRANSNAAIDHGALVIFSGRAGSQLEDAVVEDLAIEDTRSTASRQVALFSDGGALADIRLRGFTVHGGPSKILETQTERSVYTVEDWSVNGRPYSSQ